MAASQAGLLLLPTRAGRRAQSGQPAPHVAAGISQLDLEERGEYQPPVQAVGRSSWRKVTDWRQEACAEREAGGSAGHRRT